ncbi:hypothetical protein GJ629_05895 [Halapricum sp. CBA1109]|uniref:DUF7523 family protein n=1 Tax=Halapricum sp. CBA1109 TaxID=2668068 RepID=UPI0012FA7858|nr:hypothetical protein [Halapricum sp. CBA1109]MUV89483.1 hypothetical protein [Halapricum sp. CBA1109]
MSLAAETRRAVRNDPFLYEGLRAGVLNYSAAARYLDVGDTEAVVAALRRYAEELPDHEATDADVRVTMESGVGPADGDPLLVVGDTELASGGGDWTAVVATGEVSPRLLRDALGRLDAEDIAVEAAAVAAASLVVVVGRRDGADAVRAVEGVAER